MVTVKQLRSQGRKIGLPCMSSLKKRELQEYIEKASLVKKLPSKKGVKCKDYRKLVKPSSRKLKKSRKAVRNTMDGILRNIEAIKKCASTLQSHYPAIGGWSEKKKLACLLTFPDRYGSGKAKLPRELSRILRLIKMYNSRVKMRLAGRSDVERIQCQRPLIGDSLLSIVAPENTSYSKKLNALLILAQDTENGIETFRVANMAAVPFKLHKKLQPPQPTPEKPRIECKAINRTLRKIFDALQGIGDIEYLTFIENNKDVITQIGFTSKSKFLPGMRMFNFIAPVKPGKQIILWRTWHATGGSTTDTPKITAFLDLVPENYLSPELRTWYRFVCEHAPYDPGAGTSRGAWNSFTVLAREDAVDYGIPQAKIAAKWVQQRKGKRGVLDPEQLAKFDLDGYLIIDIPEDLLRKCPASRVIQEYDHWFAVLSEHPGFTFEKNINELVSTGKRDDYRYFTDKIDIQDPFNPDAFDKTRRKSHNPQAGGKMIANDSGMGPGSTFLDSPTHLRFEFSQWITNMFSSFYGEQRLLRVLERFRVKMKAAWSKNAHVDITAKRMLPAPGEYWP